MTGLLWRLSVMMEIKHVTSECHIIKAQQMLNIVTDSDDIKVHCQDYMYFDTLGFVLTIDYTD
jgi:hypothetical protein